MKDIRERIYSAVIDDIENVETNSKKEIINKIQDFLVEQGRILQDDKEMDLKDKLYKTDVVLDTFKFLNNYDENIEVLNQHLIEKKRNMLTGIALAEDNIKRKGEMQWEK